METLFNGFEESRKNFTGIPEQFFSEILPNIQDLNELKIILYLLWSAYTEGDYGIGFCAEDIQRDKRFMLGLAGNKQKPEVILKEALKKAAEDNILLEVEIDRRVYFLNTPRGRAAAKQLQESKRLEETEPLKATLDIIQPNLFRLYEENIGPLTPLIADLLKDAQNTYPEEWIKEAMLIAVKNNVRRWKYIESILERWQKEGRDGTDRRYSQEDFERYLKGEYGDIGKHW